MIINYKCCFQHTFSLNHNVQHSKDYGPQGMLFIFSAMIWNRVIILKRWFTYSKRIMPMPLNPAITRKTKPLMNLTVPMYMPCALTAPITLTAVSVADMAPYSAPAADDFVICTLSIRYVTWSSWDENCINTLKVMREIQDNTWRLLNYMIKMCSLTKMHWFQSKALL